MVLAAFEPGREIAIANFFLAIFCLFTITLPLLLITRGDKTEANREFLVATVNPWSQHVRKSEISSVILSEITLSKKPKPNLEIVSDQNISPIQEVGKVFSLEIKASDELDELSIQTLPTNDELLAA
tara:strand:+ start:119 stop:499 length:381 start_codon:yes stop_codon:yes gene_type:complete